MGLNTLREIAKYQKKVAALQKQLQKQHRKLLTLPGKLGFKSPDELIAAIQSAVAASGATPKLAKSRKARAKITDKTKAKVKALSNAGKTSAAIAKATGISVASVSKLKSELGLTRTAKKQPRKRPAKSNPATEKAHPAATKGAASQ